jgi:hypothetical protein
MNFRRIPFESRAFIVLCQCLVAAPAWAELRTFTIDQARSSLAISGTFAGIAIEPQEPGSLVTSYTGTIEADVTGSEIVLTGGSIIAALTNGNWEPAAGGIPGVAPANYGGEVANFLVSGLAALREVRFDVTSGVLPVNGGEFNAQEVVFNFIPAATSVIDYTYSITFGSSGNGSQALVGTSMNITPTNGTLVAQGDETVLTIPVDIAGSLTVLNPNDVQYRFRGQLVGRAAASLPVQIDSFRMTPGQLHFMITTTTDQSYTILGSTNPIDWPEIIDQFTATNSLSERIVTLPSPLPRQYFRVRQD